MKSKNKNTLKKVLLNSISLLILFIFSSSVFAQTANDDFDGDGINDSIDIDDDNDGIPDIDEGFIRINLGYKCYDDLDYEKVGNFDGSLKFLLPLFHTYRFLVLKNVSSNGFVFNQRIWAKQSPVIYDPSTQAPPPHYFGTGSGMSAANNPPADSGAFVVGNIFVKTLSDLSYGSFYLDLTGLEIGQTYTLVSYQANAGFVFGSAVGDIAYWEICFGDNDCRDAQDLPFKGIFNQTWEFSKMEFKANTENLRLLFTVRYRTIAYRGVRAVNSLAIDCIDVFKGTAGDDILRKPGVNERIRELNTDGDGQPNHRDLDSDNDGCYDSYEASVTGSTNNGSVTDSLASTDTTEVGSNGLADRLETSADNGIVKYISTYNKYAIDNTLNFCAKSSGCISDGISLWLKGDKGLNLSDGNAVNTWEDQSGVRNNDAASSNMSPPTFRNNAVNNINYNPVVEFDGTDDGLNYGDDYIFTSADKGGVTIFSIIRPDVSRNSTPFIYDFGNKGVRNLGMAFGDDNISIMTPKNAGGKISSEAHTLGSKPALMTMDVNYGNTQKAYVNRQEIINSAITLSKLGANQIDEASAPGTDQGPVSIGRQSRSNLLSGNFFDGAIAEISFYRKDLTSEQVREIETYLAVKYGITLGNSSSPKDYVIGGDTVWKANSAYQNNIFGIGREDCTDLHQQIARSSNNDVITISTDHNFTNQNGLHDIIPENSNYLIIGNDGKTIDWSDEELFSSSGMARTTREWNVQITGKEIDSIYISVDGSKLAYVPSIAKIYLMVDKDGDFRQIPYYGYEMTRNAVRETWELKHAFSDSDYFTIVIDYGIPHMRHGLRFKFSQQQPLNKDSKKIYNVE